MQVTQGHTRVEEKFQFEDKHQVAQHAFCPFCRIYAIVARVGDGIAVVHPKERTEKPSHRQEVKDTKHL